jgi:chromosome segregation ATPase
MTHRIEELEDLVKLLESEKLMNELTRELEEHQRAWDHEWDGSREKELNQTKLEKHVQSMQSSLEDREFQLALNSLKLRNMENQVSIKEYQTQELVKWMNEYQRQNQSREQVLSSELERLRMTNTEWAQIGQNFESLIEIERREKEELQGRFEMELRQNQIEPNFEINTLKYQLIKAENRAEQLEEQLTETAQQSNTIQTQLIAQSALKDKLSRELELADCRIKSLSGQISDLTHSLSQLHK